MLGFGSLWPILLDLSTDVQPRSQWGFKARSLQEFTSGITCLIANRQLQGLWDHLQWQDKEHLPRLLTLQDICCFQCPKPWDTGHWTFVRVESYHSYQTWFSQSNLCDDLRMVQELGPVETPGTQQMCLNTLGTRIN